MSLRSLFLFFFLVTISQHPFSFSKKEIDLIPQGVVNVGKQPKQIGITPDGKKAIVTNFGSKSISVIDLLSWKVEKTLATGGAPVELAFMKTVPFVFVTDFWGGVWKMDWNKAKVVQRIQGIRYPKGIMVSPSQEWVYFTSWRWTGRLTFFSAQTGKIQKEIKIKNRPRGIVFSKDGQSLFVCHFGGADIKDRTLAGITKYNLKTLREEWHVFPGHNARHVVLSKDGKTVIVSVLGSNLIALVNAQKGTLDKKMIVGAHPKTIHLSHDGKYLFSANYKGKSISVVNLQTKKEVLRWPMKDRLSGLDIHPTKPELYVTGWDSGKVWRFRVQRN